MNSIKSKAMCEKVWDMHYNDNLSISECAKQLRMSYLQVWRIVKKSGKPIRRTYAKSKQIRIARIMQSLGISTREIGKWLNVSKTCILQYLNSKCDNSCIAYVEIEILSNLKDFYDVKQIIKDGRYYLYGEQNGNYLLRGVGGGRCFFVTLEDLVNNFKVVGLC